MSETWTIAAMVAIQLVDAGLKTLYKKATTQGMNEYVFIFYSNAFGSLFLLLSTLFYKRKRPWTKMSLNILGRIITLTLSSLSFQVFLLMGIQYSSPTLASAMNGLVPGFTFLLAILFRMEKLDLKARSSQAKSIGTIVSIMGAFIMVFYQGLPIILFPQSLSSKGQANWIFGGFLLAIAGFLMALTYIIQTWIMKDYSEAMIVTLLTSVFATILSSIVGLVAARELIAWKLRPDVELVTIFYAAILIITVRVGFHIWVCGTKGPVFATLFNPLGLVFAVLLGVTFLKDTLHIGSVIGAVVISLGFYSVLWGKAEEMKINDNTNLSDFNSSTERDPLLENKGAEYI